MDKIQMIRKTVDLLEKELTRKTTGYKWDGGKLITLQDVNATRKNHVRAYSIVIKDLLKEIEEGKQND